MPKFYFEKEGESGCYMLSHFKNLRKERNEDIMLYEAEMEKGTDYFYCVVAEDCYAEGCGKVCPDYEPRNGKNGRCKHHRNTYNQTNKMFRLTENLKLIKVGNERA